MWKIATSNDTTVNEIINLNGLSSFSIYEGQELKIPNSIEVNNSVDNSYIVQKGDSLYSISKKYNTNPEIIKDVNNLYDNYIYIGQKLIIPSDSESNYNNSNNNSKIYVVKKGDTLWSISRLYNVSINEIRMINNLTSDILNIGQTLIIP